MPNETMPFGPLVATLWLAVVAVACRSEPGERRPLLDAQGANPALNSADGSRCWWYRSH